VRFWRRRSAGAVSEATAAGATEPEGAGAREASPQMESASVRRADYPPAAPPLGRGRPQVQKLRSVEARVGNALALALFGVLAAGFLIWYYTRAWSRPVR
jgi:hypothetical protein